MLFTPNSKIEELIVEQLQHGSVAALNLVRAIQMRRPTTTKQAVYAALRKLKNEEVIVLYKGEASLNAAWLQQLNDFLILSQFHYVDNAQHAGTFTALQDREKIQYHFHNSIQADAFWNHVILLLSQLVPAESPFVAYDPHVWFFIAHPQNERRLRDVFKRQGRQYLVCAQYNTPLDKHISAEFNGEQSQYYMATQQLFPQKQDNYYFNVLGDFIVEAYLDTTVSQAIHTFYEQTTEVTSHTQATFRKIVEQRGKTKIVISRHSAKAERLRKKLIKYFYITS